MSFAYTFLEKPLFYDGTQLRELFPRTSGGVMGNGAVAFLGGCRVELEHLVDSDDVAQNAPIYSESMLHCIHEYFDINLLATVFLQRLFISLVTDLLREHGAPVARRGDDIYANDRKLSVSIATASRVSTLIHCGFNLSSHNTPVPTISLPELGIHDAKAFSDELFHRYHREFVGCFHARCKVFGV